MFQSKPVALALVFLMIVTPCLHADVLPPGRKSVSVVMTVDLGSWLDSAWTAHVVKDGDSFSKIAKDHYGSAGRASDIAKANPKVEAKKMKLGTRLELPPKKSFNMKDGKKVPIEARRFYWWPDPGFGHGAPLLISNKEAVRRPNYSGIVVSIPHDQKKAFEEAVKAADPRKGDEPWRKVEGILVSKRIGSRRTVPVGSPTRKISIDVKLGAAKGGELTYTSSEKNYDKSGKVVTWQQKAKLPLLAASGVGLLLFAGLYTRRRRAAVVAEE